MQQWEFLTEARDKVGLAEDWNHRGKEGWELVSVIRPEADRAAFFFYFKRPLQEEPRKVTAIIK